MMENQQPDIILIDHESRTVDIVEVGTSSRTRIQILSKKKPAKYATLKAVIGCGGTYTCSLHGIVAGNLGEITNHAIGVLKHVSCVTQKASIKCLQRISMAISRDALFLFSSHPSPT